MRIWDIDPKFICNKHLLGEHRELHAIWTILTTSKKGYRKHPETLRWEGKLKALYLRHEKEVAEMKKRGFKHLSKLDEKLATGDDIQNKLIDSIERQKEILNKKNCLCDMK